MRASGLQRFVIFRYRENNVGSLRRNVGAWEEPNTQCMHEGVLGERFERKGLATTRPTFSPLYI